MASVRDFFLQGVVAGMLLVLGCEALHWFITPAASRASATITAAMAFQALVGLVGAGAIAVYRRRASRRPDAA